MKDQGANSPLQNVLDVLESVILGKPEQIRLSLATVLARGHLLVEDVPGVGKTTLVRALARVLGLETKRVQFTNDLLPADILGTAIFDQQKQVFQLHPGPIFTNALIADELNRGTPRTQSAFLQAMEERRVALEGTSRDLPNPFFVVATQNPREQVGTYALPESQLDRFLMRIHMGFPLPQFEIELLKGNRQMVDTLQALLDPGKVLELQGQVDRITCAEPVLKFTQRILAQSRSLKGDFPGLSPRSGLAILAAARAWAFLAGREFVLPEDVQAVGPWVVNHRMKYPTESAFEKSREFVMSVPVE
ncbi:MAG TPA: AAA family ATPase [Bdellovibrionales bacterium]|nr:AAA family ATPase [Bdellovibrionales bacterium]